MSLRLLVKSLALPPGFQVLLLLLAWGLRRRLPRFSAGLGIIAVISLYVLSTPVVSGWLSQQWNQGVKPATPAGLLHQGAQAIVVLGGGRNSYAPEYFSQDTVSASTLQRLRYAAFLQRQTGLPLLVSGGRVFDEVESEAVLMASVLENEFGVPVQWREELSRTTQENAENTARILLAKGIKRIALVTQGWHMHRSEYVFLLAGFEVIPAPTVLQAQGYSEGGWKGWIPRAQALLESYQILHEMLGMVVYRWQS